MGTNNSDVVRYVQVRLPADLVERMDAECHRRVVGRPVLVEAALERFLESSPPIGIESPPRRRLSEVAS